MVWKITLMKDNIVFCKKQKKKKNGRKSIVWNIEFETSITESEWNKNSDTKNEKQFMKHWKRVTKVTLNSFSKSKTWNLIISS